MNEAPRIDLATPGGAAGGDPAIVASRRIALDGRRPQPLDRRGFGMEVVAGHVDVFAVSIDDAEGEEARRHLFRVESGALILDLPNGGGPGAPMRVVAVGGFGAEAVLRPQQEIDIGLVTDWLTRLGSVAAGPQGDWDVAEL